MFKNFTAYSMLFLAITIVPEVIPFEAWAEEKKSGGGWFGNILDGAGEVIGEHADTIGGTVGGMIATFAAIQEQGLGDVDKLAGGISQALITTFAGLSVGIPALIANRFLLGRVDRLLIELEEASLAALDALAAPDVGVGVAKAADEGEDAT